MRAHRFVRVLWAVCLCAATGAVTAAVAPPPELSLDAAGPLRPGQRVTASWSPLPAQTDEFELLLQLERPVPFTLRLTESEDPLRTSLSWCVPAVPCSRARLLLRHGEGGREVLWGVSAPFRILPGPESPSQHIVLRSGELWVLEGQAPLSHTLGAGDLRLFCAPGGTPSEADSSAAGPGRPSPPQGRPLPRPAPSPALVLRPLTSSAPRNLPLRI